MKQQMNQFPLLEALLDRVGPQTAFELLVSLLPDAAVFVVDRDRNVVLWSDGAERVLGFKREEVEGRICLSGIRCRTCMLGCGLAEYGTITGYPLELFRSDSQVVATRKYAKAFLDDDGEFAGGIEVLIPAGPAFAPEAHEVGLPEDAEKLHGLISRDPAMKRVFQTLRNVSETDATVLIRGASGTGKELVARALHAESRRSDGPFVAVNCAALTPTLIESELFGHKKGAFTGAIADREGLFRQATGGTLFLDEVAELPLDLQAKLLRVLEEHVVTPVGADREVPVDIRVVAATHQSLRERVKNGKFREDLMYRLRVVPLFLPPLRDRQGDIELLLRRFLDEFNSRSPRQLSHIAPDAMRRLLDHPWPGNVRELRNVVEYAFAVGRGQELELAELPPEFQSGAEGGDSSEVITKVDSRSEEERIRWALDQSKGKVGKAIELLDMSRSTFWRKRKKYRL